MIKEAIAKLVSREDLSFEETKLVFEEIFTSQATPAQVASFLTALKMKGEKEEEIAAAARVVTDKATKIEVRDNFIGGKNIEEPVFDTCGTGGSGTNKFNISTAAAFVVSALGVKVAKHGNRAMSSTCGSADVLEFLGIKVDGEISLMAEAVKKVGIGFLYAPLYHPALKEVAQIRREMQVRTIFNILGPLCNPASANYQLLGVYRRELVDIMAKVLKIIGIKKAMVVYGKDLKDEVSLTGSTYAALVSKNKIEKFTLTPSDFGLRKVKLKDLEAKDRIMSARIIQDVFSGQKGACRDVVLANAGCCFYILGKVKNFKDGVKLGARMIDEGKVNSKFVEFKEFLNRAVR